MWSPEDCPVVRKTSQQQNNLAIRNGSVAHYFKCQPVTFQGREGHISLVSAEFNVWEELNLKNKNKARLICSMSSYVDTQKYFTCWWCVVTKVILILVLTPKLCGVFGYTLSQEDERVVLSNDCTTLHYLLSNSQSPISSVFTLYINYVFK